MRNFIYPVAIGLLTLVSCSKGEKVCCAAPEDDSIFLRARVADTTWQTNVVSATINNDSLIIYGRKAEENLRFSIKPEGTGIYAIDPKKGSFNITVGGDVTSAQYYATADTANYINISSYNLKKGIIKGEFKVRFAINSRYANSGYADKISFVSGTFNAELIE